MKTIIKGKSTKENKKIKKKMCLVRLWFLSSRLCLVQNPHQVRDEYECQGDDDSEGVSLKVSLCSD